MSRVERGPASIYHKTVVCLLFLILLLPLARHLPVLDRDQLVGDHSAQRPDLQMVRGAVERPTLSDGVRPVTAGLRRRTDPFGGADSAPAVRRALLLSAPRRADEHPHPAAVCRAARGFLGRPVAAVWLRPHGDGRHTVDSDRLLLHRRPALHVPRHHQQPAGHQPDRPDGRRPVARCQHGRRRSWWCCPTCARA